MCSRVSTTAQNRCVINRCAGFPFVKIAMLFFLNENLDSIAFLTLATNPTTRSGFRAGWMMGVENLGYLLGWTGETRLSALIPSGNGPYPISQIMGSSLYGICSNTLAVGTTPPIFVRMISRSLFWPVYSTTPSIFTSVME